MKALIMEQMVDIEGGHTCEEATMEFLEDFGWAMVGWTAAVVITSFATAGTATLALASLAVAGGLRNWAIFRAGRRLYRACSES